MSERECMEFEKKLAFHTAPALLGIKCSNLISLKKSEFNLYEQTVRFNRKASAKGLTIKILCSCKDRTLVLLYSKKLLELKLAEEKSREILRKYGYGDDFSVEEALDRVAKRIEEHDCFPHEIGVFLGYPSEDVMGFIENGGEKYTLCGYWKVYGNADKARLTFKNYDKCRNFLCSKLNQGYNIYQALKIS